MNEPVPNIIRTLPRGVLLSALLLFVMLLLSTSSSFRDAGEHRLDEAGNRAIAAFAVARTINGVVSVIQEMEVGVSLGINTTLQPGQILDPLNDLIERFSTAALIAATLLWALKLVGDFVVTPWLPLLLLGLLAARMLLARWAPRLDVETLLTRAVRIGIVIWAFAALTPWVIDSVHSSPVVQTHYHQATEDFDTAGRQLRGIVDLESPWDVDRSRLGDRMAQLADMADRLSRQAVIVLAVFVFEVLIVPIAIFWISSRVLLNPRAMVLDQAG
ncbi:MAG: hypothetical protein KDI82_02230 [Gammaproteobacteria bacterium]|nr:hypothetical protein [Gammaproteobacteria bacterium]